MSGRVTSTDVAREAGLSRATVSYVLNGDTRQTIPEATRQRVLDAAERLGYRPYGPARLLRGARSTLVLMLTPGLQHATDFVAAGIVTQLGLALREHGLHLVWQLGTEDERGASVDLAPAVVLSSAGEEEAAFTDLRQQFSVPVRPAFPGLDGFLAGAATAQVEYLAGRGRRVLAYAAPSRPELQPTSEIRWRAIRSTAERLGLPEPLLLTVPDDRAQAGRELASLLDADPAPDAVCAYNDEVAFAVLAAAHDTGVPVPGRIAVIGVDNHPLGPLAVPALSTVESDVTEFVAAFAASVAGIARGEEGAEVLLPERAQVVERAST
ncbi:LacI family DNA-binding transcriptional regulator [Naasia sp. SYSU D00948]|uniref:LacI family DNA-binding transcriptional regulator n=1 Tax=Naasia sp. SYSU D00948 TaxID=2817379 RepID=UPI001B311D48|nr:LacI family DNA-binding transcriptional regulator [Naasia sp. SYSU D00948]